jgi:ATP-binding protein involved in chromosome partitioning
MSVGFLIGERQALAWPAPLIEHVLRQLIRDVTWSRLDYIVVDLPPGTGDIRQQLVRLLSLSGAMVVVGPQDLAHLDARRLLQFLAEAGVPVLGGIGNMAGFSCPSCGEVVDVFPRVAAERSIWKLGVRLLATVPLDSAVSGTGRPLLVEAPKSPQASWFQELAKTVAEALD